MNFKIPELTYGVEDKTFDGENVFEILQPGGALKGRLLFSFTFTPSHEKLVIGIKCGGAVSNLRER